MLGTNEVVQNEDMKGLEILCRIYHVSTGKNRDEQLQVKCDYQHESALGL